MTTTVEVYAGDFLKINEAKPNTKFSDVCNRHFDRATFYSLIKPKKHLTTIYKKNQFKQFYS